jgi:hypothetical protein
MEFFGGITGWQVAHLGGNANNGLKAGAFYWNLNNDSSNSNSNIGSRQCLFITIWPENYIIPHAAWQNTKQCPIGAGRETERSGVK